jgi:hypothetical protein
MARLCHLPERLSRLPHHTSDRTQRLATRQRYGRLGGRALLAPTTAAPRVPSDWPIATPVDRSSMCD